MHIFKEYPILCIIKAKGHQEFNMQLSSSEDQFQEFFELSFLNYLI